MKYSTVLVCATIVLLSSDFGTLAQRLYIRHKRSLERENVPAKESTVVVQANETSPDPTRDLPKDFENDVSNSERDCRDFLEFDYNPLNDSMFFNGRIPSLFGGHGPLSNGRDSLNSFEQMFHRMLTQASQMFHRFPAAMPSFNNDYPDNYNGTVEEIVTIGGQQFRKKQHIINKVTGGSKFSIMSTVYEPVNANGTETESVTNSTTSGTSATETVNTTRLPDDLTDGKVISYK